MDSRTRQSIDLAVAKVLHDGGFSEPPVSADAIVEHLELHREYYDLQDAGLLRRIAHKVKVGAQRLIDVLRRVRLAALWLPDEKRILVDDSLHKQKKRWASLHEVTHSLLPWHRTFFLGDTAQTLDPSFQQQLEEEANYRLCPLRSRRRATSRARWISPTAREACARRACSARVCRQRDRKWSRRSCNGPHMLHEGLVDGFGAARGSWRRLFYSAATTNLRFETTNRLRSWAGAIRLPVLVDGVALGLRNTR